MPENWEAAGKVGSRGGFDSLRNRAGASDRSLEGRGPWASIACALQDSRPTWASRRQTDQRQHRAQGSRFARSQVGHRASSTLGVLELSTVDDPARRLEVRRQLTRLEQSGEDRAEPPITLEGIEHGLTANLALEVVPLVGDAVTIVLDYSMMKRVDRTARRVFEERWLRDSGKIDQEIEPAPPHPRDDALQTLGELAGNAVYLTSFGVSFGVTMPFALASQAARWLPGPVARGARDGARSASQFQAGWRRHGEQMPAAGAARAELA